MDEFQVSTMIDYMVGDRNVGGSHDDPAGTPHSPELRAFIVGRLGSLTLDGGWGLRFPRSEKPKAAALAALLREVADAIDPPAAAKKRALARVEGGAGPGRADGGRLTGDPDSDALAIYRGRRKIIQIAIDSHPHANDVLYALCDDGSVWKQHRAAESSPTDHGVRWTMVPPIDAPEGVPRDRLVHLLRELLDAHEWLLRRSGRLKEGDVAAPDSLIGQARAAVEAA